MVDTEVEVEASEGVIPRRSKSASARKLSELTSYDDSSCHSFDTSASSCSSASATSDSSSESGAEDEDVSESGNRLVAFELLQYAISAMCICIHCHSGEVKLVEESREGLGSMFMIQCQNEECMESLSFSSNLKGRFYDVNRRSVLAMRRIGRGYSALQKFCGIMNLPPPLNEKNFQRHQRALSQAATVVATRCMNIAAKELLQEQGNGEVAVTFDGTWQRRGFSSLNGVFVCISWLTGRVLDFYVSSKYCHHCTSMNARLESGAVSKEEYDKLVGEHKGSCAINTTRSSPGMESEAARVLWTRSEAKRNLKYVTYIGDGDSKGYKEVCQAKPYAVLKEECIGHIQKRMGKALRDLKKAKKGEKLSDGLRLGGPGRLTDEVIDKLQTYYGLAIRQSSELQQMAKAVWAGLLHRSSTDSNPQHRCCPDGVDSWCGNKRMEAGAQATYSHHNILPKAVFDAIKPVYLRLADRSVLEKCLMGATQNANESFNGVLWRMCPKDIFASAAVVELSASLAIARFNHGSHTLSSVLEEMGCEKGAFTQSALAKEDLLRIRRANKQSLDIEKQRRKKRRRRRKGWEEAKIDKEGVTYEAGAFSAT